MNLEAVCQNLATQLSQKNIDLAIAQVNLADAQARIAELEATVPPDAEPKKKA